MSGYTPTTDEIRNVWGEFSEYGGLTNRTSGGSLIDARYAEFDRWLAAHDRDIQAQALREAKAWIKSSSDLSTLDGDWAMAWNLSTSHALAVLDDEKGKNK